MSRLLCHLVISFTRSSVIAITRHTWLSRPLNVALLRSTGISSHFANIALRGAAATSQQSLPASVQIILKINVPGCFGSPSPKPRTCHPPPTTGATFQGLADCAGCVHTALFIKPWLRARTRLNGFLSKKFSFQLNEKWKATPPPPNPPNTHTHTHSQGATVEPALAAHPTCSNKAANNG